MISNVGTSLGFQRYIIVNKPIIKLQVNKFEQPKKITDSWNSDNPNNIDNVQPATIITRKEPDGSNTSFLVTNRNQGLNIKCLQLASPVEKTISELEISENRNSYSIVSDIDVA